jgi:uncharacterized membrane protein YbhN (UPF0104 family)
MIIWILIVLVIGLLMTFAPNFIAENNLEKTLGIAITLISVGLGTRINYLRRKGSKERKDEKIKKLEEELRNIKGESSQNTQ